MKRNQLLLLLALLMTAATGAWAQTQTWDSGDCTVTISDGVMTVSGTGAMADYADTNYTPWYGYRSDIETIVIESGVTSIGNFAFSRFEKLESVSIPASVTSIGRFAFESCGSDATALTVSFAEGSTPLTIGKSAFYDANLTSIDIPNRVTRIGLGAFVNCTHLESVSIPASVTSIGEGAFYYCSMLAKVYIYAPSLTTYGPGAFDDNATGRKIYVLPDAVDTYKAGWPAYAADIEALSYYALTMKDGTKDAANWTATVGTSTTANPLPVGGLSKGDAVTLKYSGRLKVKAVTANTDYDPLATPLTVEALTAGTIVVNIANGTGTPLTLSTGMKYSVNGGTKTTITETTSIEGLKAGDKVQFYGNGKETQVYGGNTEVRILGSGDGFKTKVYGNIMSLLDEDDYATNYTALPNADLVFFGLFAGNTTLTDASELLLPATTLTNACYQQMFDGCTSLTKAPKLPATTLADGCYAYMFNDCQLLTAAPKLPATELAIGCYYAMFSGCESLTTAYVKAAYIDENNECASMFDGCTATGATLHTTSDNKERWQNMMGSGTNWDNWSVADDWQD